MWSVEPFIALWLLEESNFKLLMSSGLDMLNLDIWKWKLEMDIWTGTVSNLTPPTIHIHCGYQIHMHFLVFVLCEWNEIKVAPSCPGLCNPIDYTVHGIIQARILEWVAFPFSGGSSQPRDQTQVSPIADGFFTSWTTRETQEYWNRLAYPFSKESSWPRNRTGVSCIAGIFFTNWAIREAHLYHILFCW